MKNDAEIIRGGYFSDDGEEIDPLSVPLPALCISCLKYNDAKEETPCLLNRMDQMKEIRKGETFCCFTYEPIDSSVDKQQIFDEMEKYLAEKTSD
ncbi:MAG: hypothetical protein ACOC80_12360 [Petrotogales bacterium]